MPDTKKKIETNTPPNIIFGGGGGASTRNINIPSVGSIVYTDHALASTFYLHAE